MSKLSKEEKLAAVEAKYDKDIVRVRRLESAAKRRVDAAKNITFFLFKLNKPMVIGALIVLVVPLLTEISFFWALGMLAYVPLSLLLAEYLLLPYAERQKRRANAEYDKIVGEFEQLKRELQGNV